MTTAYATAADLAEFLPATAYASIDQADVGRLLERATEVIDDRTFGAFLVDSDTDLPTDTDVATAMRDATCAQVEYWLEVGEEHDVAGMAGRQVSVGRFSIDRLPPELGPRAKRILGAAGLLTPVVAGSLPDPLRRW